MLRLFYNFTDPCVFGELPCNRNYLFMKVLRCYPPGWSSMHRTPVDFKVGDYLIPGNSTIFVSIYNVHHHPDFWQNPDLFNPNRFHPLQSIKSEKDIFGCLLAKGAEEMYWNGLGSNGDKYSTYENGPEFQIFSRSKTRFLEIQSTVSLGSKRDIKIRIQRIRIIKPLLSINALLRSN